MIHPIDQVTVGSRFRKEIGDLSDLKRSMATLGLLQSIGIDGQGRLVFGARRLAAAKELGWESIDVRIVHLDDPLQAEHDENECRKPFTVSERVAIANAIEEREKEKAQQRRTAGVSSSEGSVNFTEPSGLPTVNGEAKEKAAAAVGMSRPTLAKAQDVVDHGTKAEKEEMDRTGKVSGPHKRMSERKAKGKGDAHEGDDEARTKVELMDLLGNPVPKSLRDVFKGCTESLEHAIRIQQEVKRIVKGMEKWNAYVRPADLEKDADAMITALKAGIPHSICGKCSGKGCGVCRKEGWLTKWRYEEITKNGR